MRTSTALPLAAVVATGTVSAAGDTDDPVARLQDNLNRKIQHARDVALDVLKPTQRELEHGLQ